MSVCVCAHVHDWDRYSKLLQLQVHSYLEDVESFKLYISRRVPKHHHHQLQVLGIADVFCHCGEIVPIKQQLSKKLREGGRDGGRDSEREKGDNFVTKIFRAAADIPLETAVL